MENEVYILSACRTPIGSFMGKYSQISAVNLASATIKEAVKRANIQIGEISEVIMGQVLTGGAGQNPARQASLHAGVSHDVPSYTVNMVCGSGLKAVYNGYNSIKAKDSSIIVCGGMENMSLAKHCLNGRAGKRLGDVQVEDTILTDGLTDPFIKMHMGNTAEYLANTFKVSRSDQDHFALDSQRKAQNAITSNHFEEEIIPIEDSKGNIIDKDEHVRPNTTIETLSKLRPAFDSAGSVTAGNASGINDGAASLVISSGEIVKQNNLRPMARIVAFAQAGLNPIEMGLGPVKAIQKLMERTNWSLDDVELFEINEAFAVQSLLVIQSLNIDPNKVNVSGGAVALGHPIGCSGARVLVTLLYNLKRLKLTKGVAALCIGGGMGIAIAVEAIHK